MFVAGQCSMSSVIENFTLAYEEQQHSVLKVRIGLPVCPFPVLMDT